MLSPSEGCLPVPRETAVADAPRLHRLELPPVIDWLLNDGRMIADGGEFVTRLCERIVASGVPIGRATLHMRVLHPQFMGFNYLWQEGKPLREFVREHGVELTDAFLQSPVRVIFEGAAALRRRLDQSNQTLDFPILEDLRAEGYTDYVTMGLPDAEGRRAVMSYATRHPGGFSTEHLTSLYDMLPFLSLNIEAMKLRRIGHNLLDVYLGPLSGGRVLNGSIRRGELESINAVLWYCDLRGFTSMSDTLPSDEIIDTLNGYFEAMGEPVIARGGEVLKFIGDAMLAIFPLAEAFGGDRLVAAMESASEALGNLAKLNERREADGKRRLNCGIALHIGEVAYGNIGAPSRLDFTVIGPAVNKVVRIEAQTKRLDRHLLISADLAQRSAYPLISLGFHPLRGIAEPEELYSWPSAEAVMEPPLAAAG